MNTLWIIGAGGTVGSGLLHALALHNEYDLVCAFTHREPTKCAGPIIWSSLDVCDSMAVIEASRRFAPSAVINAAAMTDVDGCERSPDSAWHTNVLGARNVAQACARTGAHLIHLSSDYVFSGMDTSPGPYTELDVPKPINVYGMTKRIAEIEVNALCEGLAPLTVVRSSAIYGNASGGRPSFVSFIRNRLERNEQTPIVCDQWVTPTLASNLSMFLLWLINQGCTGTYHLSGPTYISRYEWALLIARHFGRDLALIRATISKDIHQLAPRPKWGGLRSLHMESAMVEGAPGLVDVCDGLAQLESR